MADIAVTAANVVPSAQAQMLFSRKAGEAISAGDILYFDSTASLMKKSDANSGTAAAKAVEGIALNSAALNQPVAYATQDAALAAGFAATPGTLYVLSATAGKIAPAADLASGMKAIVLGVGNDDGTLNFAPRAGGSVA